MPARPFAVGGRLAVPSAYIAAEPGRVGQALPLPGDRVAQGGKLQAQRLRFERRLRLCDPEVGTVSSSLELTVARSALPAILRKFLESLLSYVLHHAIHRSPERVHVVVLLEVRDSIFPASLDAEFLDLLRDE